MIRRFGWGGPVTITAIGNLKQTLKKSPDVVRGLYTGGMSLKHLGRGFDSDYLFDIVNDIMVWKEKNPPPACIMLISDRAEEVSFYFGLLRDIGYYTIWVYDGDELLPMESCGKLLPIESCGKHRRNEDIPNNCWDDTYNWQRGLLLTRDLLLTRPPRNVIDGYSSPGWVCKVCEPYGKSFDGLKFGDFTAHLKSRGHALSEIYRPERIEDSDSHPDDASSMTLKKKSIGEEEGRMKIHSLPLQQEDQMSLPLQQEVARVAVWWDINSCPVPKNFDARRVRPIIKSKLESLGYSCPITITAIGNLRLPFKKSTGVLKAIFSTGVFLLNVPSGFRHIWSQLLMWKKENPPPATLMLI